MFGEPLPADASPRPAELAEVCRGGCGARVLPLVRCMSITGLGVVHAGYLCATCALAWLSTWIDVADDAVLADR